MSDIFQQNKDVQVTIFLVALVVILIVLMILYIYKKRTLNQRNCDNLDDPMAMTFASFLMIVPLIGIFKVMPHKYDNVELFRGIMTFVLCLSTSFIIILGQIKYRKRPPNTSVDLQSPCVSFWLCSFNFVFIFPFICILNFISNCCRNLCY